MHHLFMLVVILALLPAVLVMALVVGQILFFALIAAFVLIALIYFIANPPLLFVILAIVTVYFGALGIGRAVIWIATAIENKWPDLLYRLGFGMIGIGSLIAGLAFSLASFSSGSPIGETLFIFCIFAIIGFVFLWVAFSKKSGSLTAN